LEAQLNASFASVMIMVCTVRATEHVKNYVCRTAGVYRQEHISIGLRVNEAGRTWLHSRGRPYLHTRQCYTRLHRQVNCVPAAKQVVWSGPRLDIYQEEENARFRWLSSQVRHSNQNQRITQC